MDRHLLSFPIADVVSFPSLFTHFNSHITSVFSRLHVPLLVGGCTSVPSLQFAHHSWHLHSPVSSGECKQQTAAYVEYQVRANRCKCKVLVFVSKGSEISMKHHFYIFFIQFTYLSALALILFTHPHHRVVWMSLLCSKCCNYFLQKEGQ